jgi:HAD superfamily hydrolase (TIGR01490 family)
MNMTTNIRTDTPSTAPTAEPGRAAAFFDLDGTLIPGSANIPLAKVAFRRGFVTPTELLRDLRHGVSFLVKGATDERSAQVRDRILAAVAGHRATEVEALGEHFLDDLVATIRPAMVGVLDQHRKRGHDRIVLSASPTEIVSRFAERAGMEAGEGTTAERDTDGVYTGRLTGSFCYREGKVNVMERFAADQGYDLSACYAYSDSASDLPMMEAVGHPVAVNPERHLRVIAEERGWPIIETSRVPRGTFSSPSGLLRLGRTLLAGRQTELHRVAVPG